MLALELELKDYLLPPLTPDILFPLKGEIWQIQLKRQFICTHQE